VSAQVAVTGNASDNVGVVGVQFKLDGSNLGGEVTTSPYSGTWNSTTSSNGSHTLTAVARDAAGNTTTSAAVVVTVSNNSQVCPCTIWPASTVPAQIVTGDTNAVELGVRFRADANGTISALRYYKAATNTGTHVGSLWSDTGTLLAQATFGGESSSGWQQVTLPTPVPVTANTTYVASYHTTTSFFADFGYFQSQGVDSPPLHALKEGVSGSNGVYLYGNGGAVPNQSYLSSNYWVDVVFNGSPGQPPVANDDSASTPSNTPVTINVAANDTDPNGNLDPSSASVLSAPSHGALGGSSAGSFTYTPNANFVGTDSFTYRAFDGTGAIGTATVSLAIQPVNDPPVAWNDRYSFFGPTCGSVSTTGAIGAPGSVLVNDSDSDGDPLVAVLVSQLQSGTVTLNADGSFSYSQTGVSYESFTYKASDAKSDSNIATVTLAFSFPPPSPPVAVGGGLSFAAASIGNSDDHACGITVAGVAYCWGNGVYGQLGVGTQTGSSVPVKVAYQP
jgi:hypothetical protein